ncbi:DUF1444 domain-containing protein [Bacillus timonensis]|nr:DUF1444 domain-containing protein [Bacillus timonensis]
MKKKTVDVKNELEKRLEKHNWTFNFDQKKDTLRIEDEQLGQGITISLPGVLAKWEEEKDAAIDEVVYYIEESLIAMKQEQLLTGKEKKIFPVIRSTSFPIKSNEGIPLLFDEHTAETRVYYALDLGTTYRLIDEELLKTEQWSADRIRETARFNVRSLPIKVKEDTVAGNTFYFINTNDGYDASRILNEAFLDSFEEKVSGIMAVAVPHQDVLIIVDVKNETGYDILAQMTMSFFANGRVPITALSFIYENGELEPIFILGKNKPRS